MWKFKRVWRLFTGTRGRKLRPTEVRGDKKWRLGGNICNSISHDKQKCLKVSCKIYWRLTLLYSMISWKYISGFGEWLLRVTTDTDSLTVWHWYTICSDKWRIMHVRRSDCQKSEKTIHKQKQKLNLGTFTLKAKLKT